MITCLVCKRPMMSQDLKEGYQQAIVWIKHRKNGAGGNHDFIEPRYLERWMHSYCRGVQVEQQKLSL